MFGTFFVLITLKHSVSLLFSPIYYFMKKTLIAFFLLLSSTQLFAIDSLKVLFLGNSYTAVNNLPQIIENFAAAEGKNLQWSSNTPGGYTLQQHSTNQQSLQLIAQGNWDYVVLQEQSQLPSFPDAQVNANVYPYAQLLDSIIHSYNPCTKTIFYMTWGRKNGDSQNCPNFPPLCTYQGMDSMLYLRYTNMADWNKAFIAPAGPLWHHLIDQNFSTDLYQSDESHPSAAGSFAAASAFYTVFYQSNPALSTYNYSLNPSIAQSIKDAAKIVVFDSLDFWQRFVPQPQSAFTVDINNNNNSIVLHNQSTNANNYLWNFGDGNTSNEFEPNYTYTQPGNYDLCLTAIHKNCEADTFCQQIELTTTHIADPIQKSLIIYPNPTKDYVFIQTDKKINSFQLFNSLGQIQQTGIIDHDKKISVKHLANGLYILKLNLTDGNALFVKVQKN